MLSLNGLFTSQEVGAIQETSVHINTYKPLILQGP
jgi:hypothetical protein